MPKNLNRRRWFFSRGDSDLPSAGKLLLEAQRTLRRHWRILGGIMVIYAVLYLLLVRAAPAANLTEYENLIDELGAAGSEIIKTFTLAGVALAAAGQAGSELNTIYGAILFIIVSLAFIWGLRHLFAKKKFNIRDAYYKGMTPFVTYGLMLMLILIQLLPFALGGLLFALVQSQNIAISGWEDLIFATIWLILSLVSGFFVANSIMASYAVTLPGMYPLAALKATKQLVKGRRWLILRKILFLPVVLAVIFFIVFLFLITVAPNSALWFVDLALISSVGIAHAYYYHLYRSLV